MNKDIKNYFTTGTFAKLCGVKKQTLFHYDDIGLFSPALVKPNGYRYYSYRQLYTFSIISALKELNMPLKEIKAYLDERTPDRYNALIEKKITAIDEEMEKLNKIRQLLSTSLTLVQKAIDIDCTQIVLKEQEEEYILTSTSRDNTSNENFSEYMLNAIDFCKHNQLSDNEHIGTMISLDNIISGNYAYYSNLYVKISNSTLPFVTVKPKGLYAIAYHVGFYTTIHETYERLLEYAKTHHLKLGEYLYEEYILDEVTCKDENAYITQIMVQVKD